MPVNLKRSAFAQRKTNPKSEMTLLVCLKRRANFGKPQFRQAWTDFDNFGQTASAHFQKLYAHSIFLVPLILLTLFAFK